MIKNVASYCVCSPFIYYSICIFIATAGKEIKMGSKGTIGILTGGGDVPGLNPAIRAVTIRAVKEGYSVIGIKNGWKGLINIDRDAPANEQRYAEALYIKTVHPIGRKGGTFLHSSRTNPLHVSKNNVPAHLKHKYDNDDNDLTDEVLKNLEYLDVRSELRKFANF